MGAVKSYPSRELSRLRRAWVRRNLRLLLIMLGLYVAALCASIWWGIAFGGSFAWYVIGVFHAALGASLLHLVNSAVLAHEPRAVFQLRGAWGEDNTRSELARARKKGLLWGWVDSIALRGGDLDHVVVTRRGGVVVMDSKFRTEVTRTHVADMTSSALRARTRAEGVARSVLTIERRARHRTPGSSIGVTACIVLWGPARHTVPDGHVIDGVHFVDGRRLRQWLEQLPSSPVSKVAADDLLERLTDYRAIAGARD